MVSCSVQFTFLYKNDASIDKPSSKSELGLLFGQVPGLLYKKRFISSSCIL